MSKRKEKVQKREEKREKERQKEHLVAEVQEVEEDTC